MATGIYVAASALDAYRQREEAIAQNLANLETPGYKRTIAAFSAFEGKLGAAGRAGGGLVAVEAAIDFSQGELVPTGASLDLALQGPGFFAVETAAGVRYTRAGTFSRNARGELATKDGDPILGTGGPIPLGDTPVSDVRVDERGRVFLKGGETHTLRTVSFAGSRPPLSPEGAGLYRAADGAREIPADGAAVRQGYRERANADATSELLSLIEAHRSFEAATRSIEAVLKALERTTTELR